jgi:peptidoglycan hydrolase-like protein with peptidoglycan-binding domain
MAKVKALAIVAAVGIAALAAKGASASTGPRPLPPPPKPKPAPDENEGAPVPEAILTRVMVALATQNPATMHAEAARLRAEGWTLQADSLDDAADEIEALQSNPEPTSSTPPKPPKPPTAPRALARGMKGEDVRTWQKQLVHDGFANVATDADFGERTYAATKEWQWQRELKDDGIVGPLTRAAIGSAAKRHRATPAPAPAPTPKPPAPPLAVARVRDLARGMKGEDVRAWQKRLVQDHYATVVVDADFGELTYAATKEWQWERELKDDGIVGPLTRAAIGSAPKRKHGAPAVKPPPSPMTPPPKPPAASVPPAVKPPPTTPNPSASPAVPALLVGVTLRPVPPPEPTDERVRLWQDKLKALGYRGATTKSDGKFGVNTSTQTAAFQRDRGIDPTGIADPITIASAYGSKPPKAAPAPAAPKPPKPAAPSPAVPPLLVNLSTWREVMKKGNKGQDVREWQQVLMRYGHELKADGDFGALTEAATKQWQTEHARFADSQRKPLSPDGAVGKNTRDRIAELERGKSIVAGGLALVQADVASRVLPMFERISPQLLGIELEQHLRATPPGLEDRELVQRFQRAHGLNDTGVFGPATAEALIPIGIIPPDVRDWPQKKLYRAKNRYRVALREAAGRDPERSDEWLRAAGRV